MLEGAAQQLADGTSRSASRRLRCRLAAGVFRQRQNLVERFAVGDEIGADQPLASSRQRDEINVEVTGSPGVQVQNSPSVWVGVYAGPEPGQQIARSTGLRGREAALGLTRRWEATARRQRQKAERDQPPPAQLGRLPGLTQAEVALVLGLTPRVAVAVERNPFDVGSPARSAEFRCPVIGPEHPEIRKEQTGPGQRFENLPHVLAETQGTDVPGLPPGESDHSVLPVDVLGSYVPNPFLYWVAGGITGGLRVGSRRGNLRCVRARQPRSQSVVSMSEFVTRSLSMTRWEPTWPATLVLTLATLGASAAFPKRMLLVFVGVNDMDLPRQPLGTDVTDAVAPASLGVSPREEVPPANRSALKP
jgi:hypothetical protein